MHTTHSVEESIELALQGEQTMTKCPAHPDNQASLHVSPGREQPVVMLCQAGCETKDVLHEGGIDIQALLAERDDDLKANDEWTPVGPASHRYPYTDEDGTLLFEVMRIPPQEPGKSKTFMQRTPDPSQRSGWRWNLQGVRRVLYRLPEVLQAKANGQTIYVVEGEKDVETLRRQGLTATTSPMGAGKWRDEYTDAVCDSNVVIIADADERGREHARQVYEAIIDCAASVAIWEPNGVKDTTDHYDAGYRLDDFVITVPAVSTEKVSAGIDVLDAIERDMKDVKYVVPNVLARGDRLLITAFEGHGKSLLLRQIAAMVAGGIHPWNLTEIPPQKVLVIDAENHPDQVLESWKDLVGLLARHGRPIDRGQLILEEKWDDDIDLTGPTGHKWLIERMHAHKPDLVTVGPLYNMASRDLREDETARKLKAAINEARAVCGSAFIMEHHAPHKAPGDRERSVRPYGSSVFLKWPDFGYGLRPVAEAPGTYEFQRTRFPRVRSRYFPTHLRTGKPNTLEFPWMETFENNHGGFGE